MVRQALPVVCALFVSLVIAAHSAAASDWPQWGGTSERNMVSTETGLPDSFVPGKKKPGGGIDMSTTHNVRWVARLGSAAYGNPTVSQGRVLVGTDDLRLINSDRFKRTRAGLVKCFDEQTGRLLWQLVIPRRTDIPKEMHFGHQFLGVCSSPTVEGDRVYVVGSGGDVLCLDLDGLADGNDGPFREEAQYMQPAATGGAVELEPGDADIVWRFDLIEQLHVFIHDAASCSPLVCGDLVYVGTSNGVDEPHEKVLNPNAPALIALDKHTGRLAAVEGEHISERLYHAQWASPSLGKVNGKTLLFFGGGDGVCYAFEAIEKVPPEPAVLRKVWSYDCNPPQYKYRDGKPIPYYAGDKRKHYSTNKNDGKYVGPSQIIATPVFCENRVYVAIGQDPAHGRGAGMLHCIDATGNGDITHSGRVWAYDKIERSLSTVAVADGLVYAADLSGKIHCLDADTGEVVWVYRSGAETWGGPLVADGKLFFGNKRAYYIMAAGREPKVLFQTRLGAPVYTTAVAANGTVYVASQRYLWAVATTQAE